MATEVQLPENMTIHYIETHFGEINKAFNEADNEIVINANKLETIDTSGLQSLLTLIKYAAEQQKQVSWQDTPEVLEQGAEKIGLSQALQLN
ncbi:STAS domain-containing protein [Thiomicrorhabdus sediminis]|uniref:STAS domain-containing protein n=1 Tax=Thiomicrorhabdus sediminis TaxID=2580412 RepID=A0A4P9K7I9_9GAMM|nr:STAS domain-containing protein [Thiomicrorhabdus sediminis]QCU90430.1 STAS domain-containing protein [Thiomicrorhabdus sediminis]